MKEDEMLKKLEELENKIDDFLATHNGFSLRDYFAGQVIAGMGEYLLQNRNNLESLAQSCYNIADAMLEIRG